MKKYSTVLFDLFNTLVMFEPSFLSPVTRDGKTWNTTARDVFSETKESLEGMEFDDFYEPFAQSHREIMDLRKKDMREYPSRKRFEIFVERAGLEKNPATVNRLVHSHMKSLQRAMVYPEHHTEILGRLARKGYTLAVVSNFDHAPTAVGLLEKFGIAGFFSQVVISEEVGWRKPHRKIFEFALEKLGEPAPAAVFIGDDPEADVEGAENCGIDSIWVKRKRERATVKPRFTISDLSELEKII